MTSLFPISPKRSALPIRQSGFTLVELLTVIAVVAILGAILLPAVRKAIEKSHMTTGISNARQLATATQLYAADNNGIINGMGPTYVKDGGDIDKQWDERAKPYLGVEPTDLINPSHPDEIWDLNGHMGWAMNVDFTPRATEKFNSQGVKERKINVFRTFGEIQSVDDVIFAVDGYRIFSEKSGQIPGFVFPETIKASLPIEERIFFPYDGKTIVLYLDWHIDMLDSPIDVDLIDRPITR